MKQYESSGILRIVKSSDPTAGYWMWLECCRDLARYQRRQILMYTCLYRGVMEPKEGPHVTIVRREFVTSLPQEGRTVSFLYGPELQTNGKHFWFNVECEEMKDMRESIGLPREPWFPLHITVGVMPGERDERH